MSPILFFIYEKLHPLFLKQRYDRNHRKPQIISTNFPLFSKGTIVHPPKIISNFSPFHLYDIIFNFSNLHSFKRALSSASIVHHKDQRISRNKFPLPTHSFSFPNNSLYVRSSTIKAWRTSTNPTPYNSYY